MNPHPVAPARPALLTLAQFSALYFLLAVAAIALSRQPGNIATLWFANALGIAYLLTQPRLLAPALLLCAGGANLLANLLYGDAPALAITFLPANMLEMAIGAWLVSRSGRALAFDESPAKLLRFIGLACCVPPLIGATLGAGSIATQGFAGFSRVWPAWYAGVIELVCGLLIMVGLFTRAAAFIASGAMAVAYFWQHQPMGLWPIAPPEYGGNGGLDAIAFCFVFFLLVFTGPGPFSVDRLRTRTPAG